MAPVTREEIVFEDTRLLFRNFAGREEGMNRAGARNFNIVLSREQAEVLLASGWNVKYLKPREEGDEPLAVLKVSLNYRGPRPPKVVMITSRGRTSLPEATVDILDFAEIRHVDLSVRPYDWKMNGAAGRSAYLKALYVTIEEDALERKYGDMEALGSAVGPAEHGDMPPWD